MKIVDPYAGVEPNNEGLRKQRLDALLRAWRMPRAMYLTEPGKPPEETELSTAEWSAWLAVLRAACSVPPRCHRRGLETYARIAGHSVDELERDKVVLILDDQVAVRSRQAGLRIGYHWSVLVPAKVEGPSADEIETVLRKRFREVQRYEDEFLASGSYANCTDTVSVLIGNAVADTTPGNLRRMWELSLALDLERRFVSELPLAAAGVLADLLQAELTGVAHRLDFLTSAQLFQFAEGFNESHAPELILRMQTHMPASRFAAFLDAASFFDNAHHPLVTPYYEDVISAYVRTARVNALGDLLLALPVGHTLLAAIDTICLDRPEFIGTFVWHPAFRAEGALALLRLPQRIHLAQAQQLDLTQEWLEVQRLGRELMVLTSDTLDWSSLVALGIHDEARTLGRTQKPGQPRSVEQAHYQDEGLWAKALHDPDVSEALVGVLERSFHLRGRYPDPAIIFALKMLPALRESDQGPLAARLARAIVDGYASKLTLDDELISIPRALWAHGELLAALHVALRNEDDGWRKLLRPFDREAYVERAKADSAPRTRVTFGELRPVQDVPEIFRAHAETLVALALAIDAFDEPLQAALELYETDSRADLTLEAFSWFALAPVAGWYNRPSGESLFVRVGRLFGRMPDSPQWLRDLLDNEQKTHILAYIAAGLGSEHPLSEQIHTRLRSQVNGLLIDRDGIALGLSLELANQLLSADMARESERLATRALEMLEGFPRNSGGDFEPVARALLAGSLAKQGLWPEILAFEPETQNLAFSHHSRFIENMRALALMETGKMEEAEQTLRLVLSAEPADAIALVNLTGLHLRTANWKKALECADAARERLPPGDDLDRVQMNEAFAREQLGDRFGATTLLSGIASAAKMGAAAAETLERLRREGLTVAPIAPDAAPVASEGAVSPDQVESGAVITRMTLASPPESAGAVHIAIITALKEEYLAVKDRLFNVQTVPAGQGQTYPNIYSWVLGDLPKTNGSDACRIVLAWAGSSGNLRTAITTMRTIDRWRPRYVVFSGIAGGLKKEELNQGDIVLSQTIWYYEYGKVSEGKYKPRHLHSFPVDRALLSSARTFESATSAWKQCGLQPPLPNHIPKLVHGTIGSGEKVIDDLDPPFVRAILEARSELQAIEMEAAGACEAIENAHAEGKMVGFLMVRGISDMPAEWNGAQTGLMSRALDFLSGRRPPPSASAGTVPRDKWKLYASAISAEFVAQWLASPQSPV